VLSTGTEVGDLEWLWTV